THEDHLELIPGGFEHCLEDLQELGPVGLLGNVRQLCSANRGWKSVHCPTQLTFNQDQLPLGLGAGDQRRVPNETNHRHQWSVVSCSPAHFLLRRKKSRKRFILGSN